VVFYEEPRIVAVYGIRHKGQDIPARDIAVARKRMSDWKEKTE